ncbi:MAG: hypothetical protein OXI67_00855 [Candidatus Poribacteria bacterium]|nr:hypothetical protein [Candidatus Poribacteria bacterium]
MVDIESERTQVANLQEENTTLDDTHNVAITQRDKFKQKFEELVESFGRLKDKISIVQSQGLLGRIKKRGPVNLGLYPVPAVDEDENDNTDAEEILSLKKMTRNVSVF